MVSRGLIFPEEATPKEREKLSEKDKEKDDLHFFNMIVFGSHLFESAGPSTEFKEVVQERLHIAPIDQRYGMMFEDSTYFQLAIDFLKYYNREYEQRGKDYLRFAIDWLEDMRTHPEKHHREWNIWEESIKYVLSPPFKKGMIF